MDYKFRPATFNGFNREDVIGYIETTVQSHNSRVQRLQDKLATANANVEKAAKAEEDKSREIDELNQVIADLREQLNQESNEDVTETYQEEISTMRETIAMLESTIENNTLALNETEKQYATELRNLETELEQLRLSGGGGGGGGGEDVSSLKEEVETYQLRLERMTQTIEELESASEQAEMDINHLKSELKNAREAVNESDDDQCDAVSNEEIESLRKSLSEKIAEIDTLNEEFNQSKIEVALVTKVSNRLEEEAEIARDHVESLKLTISDLEHMSQSHDTSLHQLNVSIEAATAENEQLKSKLQKYESQISTTNDTINEYEQKLKTIENDTTQYDDLQSELDIAKKELLQVKELTEKLQLALDENDSLTASLNEASEKLLKLAQLESELAQNKEKLSAFSGIEVQFVDCQEKLSKMQHIESDFNAAQGRLSRLNLVESELETALRKLEKLNIIEAEYNGMQEKLTRSAGIEAELTFTKEKLNKLEELLRSEQTKAAKLDLVEPELMAAQEKLKTIEQLDNEIKDLRAQLETARTESLKLQAVAVQSAPKEEILLLENKITDLTQQVKEAESTLLDEKQKVATALLDLDKAKETIAKHLDQEWAYKESIKKISLERDTLSHKLSQAEPAAKAYITIQNRISRMERDAHCRAQDTINEAEAEVFRLQEQVEQWLSRVNSSYSSLWREVEDNIKNVDKGLIRASDALTQINTVMSSQDTSFLTLTSKHSKNLTPPQRLPAENPKPQWAYEPPPTPQWNHEPQPTPQWNPEPQHAPQWNTEPPIDPQWSTPPSHHWSTGPSPLPLEDDPNPNQVPNLQPLEEDAPKRFQTDFKLF